MFIFLQLSLLYLGGWGVMFYSDTFRFIFLNWAFFCVMASASAALTVLTFVLGVFCRFNFGKGLPEYRKLFLSSFRPLVLKTCSGSFAGRSVRSRPLFRIRRREV